MVLIPSGAETNAEYHASGAWGSTRINDFIRSPQIAWLRMTGKLPQVESASLTLGQALHARFDGSYAESFVAGPKVSSRRTKAWQAAEEAHQGKTLLLPAEVACVDAMQQAVQANPYARVLLDQSQHEVGVRRQSPFGDYRIQARFDLYLPGQHIADIKTTSDLDGFAKSVQSYGYARQASFYRWLLAQQTSERLPFFFIVVEKSAPHRCRVIDLAESYLDHAWHEVEQALISIGQRYQSGDWSDSGYLHLEAPAWLIRQEG